ncbi:hypothetical protein FV230_28040 [Methylobacterium sp. WL6]|nr:hypothetical protein FV230_28040 [Methylobacterium sp. WL6]
MRGRRTDRGSVHVGGVMRLFVTRSAWKQACKGKIAAGTLAKAAEKANLGLVDAEIGAHLYKQHVGRKGDFRAVLFLVTDRRCVVLHIFPKNVQPNIKGAELTTLRAFAKILADVGDAGFETLAETQGWKDLSDEKPETDL